MGAAVSYCSPQKVLSDAICEPDGKGPDYGQLPCPVKFEEITREAYMSLKPELFEGLRFDMVKSLNNKFALSKSMFMGSIDTPASANSCSIGTKNSAAHFEFGANLVDQKGKMDIVLMMGRNLADARVTARVKYDVNSRFSIKANAQLTNDPHFTVGMFNFDYKGNDYQAQLTMGNSAYYAVNYMQSVTHNWSFGGEGIWLGHQRKSCMSLASRYKNDTVVATALMKSEGLIKCTYVQKLSTKVTVASDFVYNWENRDAISSVAYDYLLDNRCRVRGRVDTNLCTAAYLEEKFPTGLTILLSAELDHRRKDYKFGFGVTFGD